LKKGGHFARDVCAIGGLSKNSTTLHSSWKMTETE
jgi:hypothetical protein